jgi:uncharacterized membrane protein
VRASHPEAP